MDDTHNSLPPDNETPDTPANTDEPAYEPTHSPRQLSLQEIEQLNMAEWFGLLMRQPIGAWAALQAILSQAAPTRTTGAPSTTNAPALTSVPTSIPPRAREYPAPRTASPELAPVLSGSLADEAVAIPRSKVFFLLAMRLCVLLLAWSGNALLSTASRYGSNSANTQQGIIFVGLAFVAWVGIEIYAHWKSPRSSTANADTHTPPDFENDAPFFNPVRIALMSVGLLSIGGAIAFTTGNRFTYLGFVSWMLSIVTVAGALASDRALFERQPFRLRIPSFWRSYTFYALVLIVLVGAYFRINALDRTPPQMTSDHVEKLLDAQRVLDGNPQVFFPNNGGREPLQMYLMALLSLVPGLGMNFNTLKLLSIIEGLITLPMLWWMAREVIGKEQPRLGNWVGLALAALVAVSAWHTGLSRLALRIVLTPFVSAWLLIYLGRAMRWNRRDDFLKAGLVLGAGLYMYQAVRMLPVVVIVGVGIALLAKARSGATLRRYVFNFAALVFVSFVVFVPLFSFSLQNPDLFWRRTTGRLLGDSVVQETLADGSIVQRNPTLDEQAQVLQANLEVLGNNIRNVVLMFNWKGDVAWINNAPNMPQMDVLVGALFVLGLAGWGVRIVRRRDTVDLLMPLMLFIMLLPSALAIAYPVENPSATRTSGALPIAYLMAAYPLALLVQNLGQAFGGARLSRVVGVVSISTVMLVSFSSNSHTYFQLYHDNYLLSSLPYKQAGRQMRAFSDEVGHNGNAFMIAYPYWWDHRALGLEAGLVDFPNGILSINEVPQFLRDSAARTGKYQFYPDAPILFFYSTDDTQAAELLSEWFPEGESLVFDVPEQRRSYATYRVPPLGATAFADFLSNTLENTAAE